jgi:uncharacterized protein (DUF1499 family)
MEIGRSGSRPSGKGPADRRRRVLPLLLVLAACHPPAGRLSGPGEPLLPCPASPNCVSTDAVDERHAMEAIPFHGSAADAQRHAREALLREPRTRIVAAAPGYLRAEARSRILRFVDDVQVVVDDRAKVIRFRSASRVGKSDLGVNRKRMRRFGERFRALDAGGGR